MQCVSVCVHACLCVRVDRNRYTDRSHHLSYNWSLFYSLMYQAIPSNCVGLFGHMLSNDIVIVKQ